MRGWCWCWYVYHPLFTTDCDHKFRHSRINPLLMGSCLPVNASINLSLFMAEIRSALTGALQVWQYCLIVQLCYLLKFFVKPWSNLRANCTSVWAIAVCHLYSLLSWMQPLWLMSLPVEKQYILNVFTSWNVMFFSVRSCVSSYWRLFLRSNLHPYAASSHESARIVRKQLPIWHWWYPRNICWCAVLLRYFKLIAYNCLGCMFCPFNTFTSGKIISNPLLFRMAASM